MGLPIPIPLDLVADSTGQVAFCSTPKLVAHAYFVWVKSNGVGMVLLAKYHLVWASPKTVAASYISNFTNS